MATLTVYAGTEDGHVISNDGSYSGARSGPGDSVTDTSSSLTHAWSIFSPNYYIYQAMVSFDTSPLTVDDTITAADYSLYCKDIRNVDNWDDIYARLYDWGTTLQTSDFRATDGTSATDTLLASLGRTSWTLNAYNTLAENGSNFVDNINKGGKTRLYTFVSNAEASTAPTDDNAIIASAADTSGTTQDPKLVVTYTPPISIDSVTPSEFADGDTGVTIAGSGFEASQGTGKVELGDSSDYATATLVAQTVTSWSDTSIDFTVVQGALSSGTVYVFVTNDSGNTTAGFEATLIHELAAVATGTSTAAGAFLVTRNLAAQSDGVSTAAGAFLVTRNLAAQSDGVSTAAGVLTVDEAAIKLAAVIAGQSAASAGLTLSLVLAAAPAGQSTVSGSLSLSFMLAAAPAGQSTVVADLSASYVLAALIEGQSEVTAVGLIGILDTLLQAGRAEAEPLQAGRAEAEPLQAGRATTERPRTGRAHLK